MNSHECQKKDKECTCIEECSSVTYCETQEYINHEQKQENNIQSKNT